MSFVEGFWLFLDKLPPKHGVTKVGLDWGLSYKESLGQLPVRDVSVLGLRN